MNEQIWKQPLRVEDRQVVTWPKGSHPIHVAEQAGHPTIWFKAKKQMPKQERVIVMRGTGQPLEPGWFYLGSAHCGSFVWHVFEDKSENNRGA